jgi:hypothetical protein
MEQRIMELQQQVAAQREQIERQEIIIQTLQASLTGQ